MTHEVNYLIELKDILGIEFACHNCKAKIVLDRDLTLKVLNRGNCPLCNEEWFYPATLPRGFDDENTSIARFLHFLSDAEKCMQGRHFSLKLRIVPPPKP
jgi:hypothetical protein